MSRSWDLMDGMFECEVWKLVDDLNEVADSHGLIVVLGPSTWRFCQRVLGVSSGEGDKWRQENGELGWWGVFVFCFWLCVVYVCRFCFTLFLGHN